MTLGLTVGLHLATPAFAATRTFTDTSGRTITAEVMEATETTVRLRRDDGRVFEIPLQTLMTADREHVSAWRTARDFAFGGIVVSAHRVRVDTDRTQTRASVKKNEDWCYKLTIANRSRADLTGLTVEYRAFFVEDTVKTDRDKPPLERETGRATLGLLAAGESTEVQSTIVTLQVIQLKPGYRIRGTSKRRVEDALAGIWVRVMHGDEIMHEFADPTTLMKTESW